MPSILRKKFIPLLIVTGLWLMVACNDEKPKIINTQPPVPTGLPQISIETENGASIVSKTEFLNAKIKVDGGKDYQSFNGNTKIRGRGNYTWVLPKKPYKIKLEADTPLLGMAAEKDWVLLANYLDGSLMLNAVSMKIGQLMDMPFTNNIVPIDLTINGKYQGSYMLTEQIEVKSKRVNAGKDGLLLVIDTNYDEAWKFRSQYFNLPVMIKYPELSSESEILPIKAEFEQMESLISKSDFPNNNYLDYFDAEAMANYFLVYLLTCNEEINHPKSTYLYKTAAGKFTMGPIWDFDWAFSYEQNQIYYTNPNRPLFWNSQALGSRFFSRIMEDPKIKTLVKQKWAKFRAEKYNQIDEYINSYSELIQKSRAKDFDSWRRGSMDFNVEVNNLKQWFVKRGEYVDLYLSNF